MRDPVLTLWQPWADLVMADDGAGGCWKPVENRGWRPPSTLPKRCRQCGGTNPDSTIHTLHPEMVAEGSPFPSRLWIHAGQRAEPATHPAWVEWFRTDGTDERGVLLGSVLVTGCHRADECKRSPWQWCSRFADPDVWHWTLTDPQPLDAPVPMRGHQRLWDLAWHLDPKEVPAHA